MNHCIRHGLDEATARRVMEKAAETYIARFPQYSPGFRWASEGKGEVSFKAMGMTAKGMFTLRDGEIDVDMDVPFVLRPFRAKALEVIETEVKRWVEKAKGGAL